ncbi:Serine/threonine-protein kinase TOR [Diplonema papillatum]|nr:Serine/threonine-protein kinase TOR [Diplonema papillatum]
MAAAMWIPGTGNANSMSVLECLRKLMTLSTASEETQNEHIEHVLNAIARSGIDLPDNIVQHINKDIRNLFTVDPASRLLGIKLLLALTTVEYWEFSLKITFFYNLLKACHPSSDPTLVHLAAKCIAGLAAAGAPRDNGLLAASIVEEEIRKASDWLSAPDRAYRWYSSCVSVENLVRTVPELAMPRCDALFDRLWLPMWSESLHDRQAAVSCFRAIIDTAFTDDQDWTGLWQRAISKVTEGLLTRVACKIHGSLLCVKELLLYSKGQFTQTDYRTLGTAILNGGMSEDVEIQRASLEALVRLAAHYEDLFGEFLLDEAMQRLASLFQQNPSLRDVCYRCLCDLVTALGATYVEPHFLSIVQYVRLAITHPDTKRHGITLLGLLATSCPSQVGIELLGEEWSVSFQSEPVTDNHFEVMQRIMTAIPSLRRQLVGINQVVLARILDAADDIPVVALALRSVGTVESCLPTDAAGARLFLRHRILPYLSHDEKAVRSAAVEAAVAALKFLVEHSFDEHPASEASSAHADLCTPNSLAPSHSDRGGPGVQVPAFFETLIPFLEPILDLAVVDMVDSVRHCALSCLEQCPEAANLLAASKNGVDCLFISSYDHVSENRRLALLCLCRLAHMESVMDGLTKTAVQLSEDMAAIRDSPIQLTQCSELLYLLITHVPTAVVAMAPKILDALKERLQDPLHSRNPQLVFSLLRTLGELNDLINADDGNTKQSLLGFLPLVLECLEDRHHINKRLAAVNTLIKIIRSTGLVIGFYREYPQVLPILLGFLQAKEDWQLQCGVMRLIGTIGAVDPLRAKNLAFWAEVDRDSSKGKSQGGSVELHLKKGRGEFQSELLRSSLRHQFQRVSVWKEWNMEDTSLQQLPMRSQPGLVDQLPGVALRALLLILANQTRSLMHAKTIDSIRHVIKSLSQAQLVKFCPDLLNPILQLLRQPVVARDTHAKLFQVLNTVVTLLGSQMTPAHCQDMLEVIKDYWGQILREAKARTNAQSVTPPAIQDHRTDNTGSDSSTYSGHSTSPVITGAAEPPAPPNGNGSHPAIPGAPDRGSPSLTPFDPTQGDKTALDAATTLPVETLLINLISLVEELGKVETLHDTVMEHAKWLLRHLIVSITIDRLDRMELVQKCFDAFKSLASFMEDHLHGVLPVLLEPLSRSDVCIQLRVKSLNTLYSVLESTPCMVHTAQILHRLLATARDIGGVDQKSGSAQVFDLCVQCIRMLVRNADTAFMRFVPLTKKVLGANLALKQSAELASMLASLEQTGKLPPEKGGGVKGLKHDANRAGLRQDKTQRLLTCVLGMGVEGFSSEAFRRTIGTHLRIPTRHIQVLRVRGPACTVDFTFGDLDQLSASRYTNMFCGMVKNANGIYNSALGHELRLVELKEKTGAAPSTMQTSALQAIWSTRGRRKTRDWEEWINRLSVEVLKHSPSQALRACYNCAHAHIPLGRDLFSYAMSSCFQELDEGEKCDLLSHMNNALRHDLPPFVLHMILSLAEFMEEERHRSVYSTQTQSKQYKMTRQTTQARFGVGYADVKCDGSTRVQVSKIAPDHPGDWARLPIGGTVVKLNATRIRNVKQLSELLEGQTSITLEILVPNTIQRLVTKPGPFFDVDLLASVCERKQLLAKALHYKEERFRELIHELKKAGSWDDASKLSESFIELCSTLIHLNNNLGLREAANGVLDFSKKYFEEWIRPDREDADACSFSKIAGKKLDSMLLIEGRGYEKLQWWSAAIRAYKTQAALEPDTSKYLIGIMRCYRQLGRWEHLLYEAKRGWMGFDLSSKEEISGMAAHGAWILSSWANLGQESVPSHWEFMETCVRYMPREGEHGAEREFFQAILAVHREEYTAAEQHINDTRRLLEGRLSSLVGESYARAYNIIVWLQKVTGLEEVVEYRLGSEVKWPQLKDVWRKRMFGMEPTVENWQDMLGIMALASKPENKHDLDSDDLALWLKFVSICRRCNRNSLAESTLLTLMGFSARNFRNFLTDDTVDQHLSTALISATELLDRNVEGHVCLSYFKHLYHCDMRTRACDELRVFVSSVVDLRRRVAKARAEISALEEDLATRSENATTSPTTPVVPSRQGPCPTMSRRNNSVGGLMCSTDDLASKAENKRDELRALEAKLEKADFDDDDLIAKMHLTVGEWYQELHKDNFWESPYRKDILSHFDDAVTLNKNSSRAWHCWGLLNYRIAFRADSLSDPDADEALELPKEEHDRRKEEYLVQSLRGFYSSLEHLEDESFCVPNLLRILNIWFRYAQHDTIASELLRGQRAIPVSIWIYVLPQLVARVSFPQPRVREQVENLLVTLGSQYPHHVVYPITVCAVHGDSSNPLKRRCAQQILDRLSHGEREKIFIQAKIVSQGLIKTAISWAEYWYTGLEEVAKYHERVNENGLSSMKSAVLGLYPMLNSPEPTIAEQAFLDAFLADLEAAKRHLLMDQFKVACDRYRRIWDRLKDSTTRSQKLLLTEVAPQLLSNTGLEVAVPGISSPNADHTVLIKTFHPEVRVIQSKQKPKVINMVGDDGKHYKFLLKGHEDMRQDERVMQLFGLVNALFKRADDLYHIHIIRTPVVPLSDNVGLVGWLEKTETLFFMISEYRKARSIPVNLEVAFIMRMGQLKTMDEYYKLPDKQKEEILAACLEKTPSDCLRRVFWTKTATSELWLEYRTHYARTLACMSMVGYILGLGDRHLNNIMLTKEGQIVHIDFGDCFEVAVNRQRFPEQVPFRLTRMLVAAMEASGNEGTFRYTCESVMRCLRKNRDSLTSLLETFVYDPLINWRLLETVNPEEAEAHRGLEETSEVTEKETTDNPSTRTLQEETPSMQHDDDDEEKQEKKGEEAGVDEMNIPADEIPTHDDDLADGGADTDDPTNADDRFDVISKSIGYPNDGTSVRSFAVKSVRWEQPGQLQIAPAGKDDRAWEEELVNEKAKQVVIRIREKLAGFDFPKSNTGSRNPPSPKGISPKHEPAADPTGYFDPVTSRYMMLGGGSYEGSWVHKAVEDDECDIGVSVAHRETWWLNQNHAGAAGSDNDAASKERCTVQEQVSQLILASTSVANLSQMFVGWCPFW